MDETAVGPLGPWLALLRLGEVLRVGKGMAFGLGRYPIEEAFQQARV